MKWSKYNFLFHSEKYGHLLYNSLTNCFIKLDPGIGSLLEKLRSKQIDDLSSAFSEDEIIEFRRAKILVDNDYDEYLQLKLQKHLKRFDKSHLTLTIAPTLDCNFCCSYCFEGARPNIYMSDETEDRIINFIRKHSETKDLIITWFGGEPLLDFKRIISLTNKIKELKINFSSSIITNGYLLNESVIDKFPDLKIKHIHITIDGTKEVHNRRRPHISDSDSFSVIYSNILNLKPYLKNKEIALSIRINIDKANEESYHEIYQMIRADFEDIDISVYPGIVKNTYGSCSSVDDNLMDHQAYAKFIARQFTEYGIKSSEFFPIRHNGECIARQVNGYLIDARGDIFKCWTDTGNRSESIGNVCDLNSVNSTILTRYLTGADPFDDPKCQRCFFFPVCGGGCPHLSIKKITIDNRINLCHIAKGNLKAFLEMYYEITTMRNN